MNIYRVASSGLPPSIAADTALYVAMAIVEDMEVIAAVTLC